MDLTGKTAVITGSARGIGREIAEVFAAHKAKIVISDVMEDLIGPAAVEIADKYSVETMSVKCDVSSSADCEELVKQVTEKFGSIDILVNNAGITRDGLLMRMKDDDWDLVLNINLKGTFLMSRAVIRSMIKNRFGRIINIASIVGQIGNAGQANYSASKGGVISLTKTIAREVAAKNVNVNAIAPGFIATDMTDKLGDSVREALISQIPQAKLGTPKDIANAALFLASDLSDYITGQIIAVNGGMNM